LNLRLSTMPPAAVLALFTPPVSPKTRPTGKTKLPVAIRRFRGIQHLSPVRQRRNRRLSVVLRAPGLICSRHSLFFASTI